MKPAILIRLAIAVVILLVLFFTMFTYQVRENEKTVLTRFGQPVRVVTAPGLYFKWPVPVETVHRFDARLAFFESRPSETLTQDKRNVVVFVFTAWTIADPLKFLQAVGSREDARTKLDGLVTSAKNAVIARYDFGQLVSTDPGAVKLNEIEERMTESVAADALKDFGIRVRQVGINRLGLPETNTEFVFARMRAERAKISARFRSEGEREADAIRANTDAEITVLLAEAAEQAAVTRGEAEAEAARLYAEAYQADPGLYEFLRKLQALREVTRSNTTLLLDTSTPPFDILQQAPTAP
ncbi:MAG: protease modulator HflC [Verrucomicrobiota bacterium]